MGNFNTLIAPIRCPRCGDKREKPVQFRFGFVDGRAVHLASEADWFPADALTSPVESVETHTGRPPKGTLKAIGYLVCMCGRSRGDAVEKAVSDAKALYDSCRKLLLTSGRLKPRADVKTPDFIEKLHERGDFYFLVDGKERADIFLLHAYRAKTGKFYPMTEEVCIAVAQDKIVSAELAIYEPFYRKYPVVSVGPE